MANEPARWNVPEEAPESNPYLGNSVKDYGAIGDGFTDDTVAIQLAIETVKANPGTLYFPPGDYLVTGLTLDNLTEGMNLVGAGRDVTRLLTLGSTPIISLGTYDSTPANPWLGTASGLHLSSLTLQNIDDSTIAHVTAGDQTSIGIQDNGSGGVTLRDVAFWGLKYGVYAPYGHDYCRYYDVDFMYCTTSMYFGPGSQQIYIYGGSSTLHNRAIVIEGALQGAVYRFVFNEPRTRDVDILSPDTLESGCSGAPMAPYVQLSWSFNDCWFETGAGFATSWNPHEHVRIGHSTDTNLVRGPVFRNVHLVSGTAGMAAHTGGIVYAFLNANKGRAVEIDRILIEGSYIEAIVTHPAATYHWLLVRNATTVDGYSEIPAFDPWEAGQQLITDDQGRRREMSALPSQIAPTIENSTGDAIRFYPDEDGGIVGSSYISAAWHDRFHVDMNQSRLYLGESGSADFSVEWYPTAPTFGEYRVGDIIFNQGAAPSGKVGWVCTTAGTAGDDAVFKTFGDVTA